MVGISEELIFRGVLFHGALSSFGIWLAVWITAIVFGSVHTLNGLITGDFRASAVQAFLAGMLGFGRKLCSSTSQGYQTKYYVLWWFLALYESLEDSENLPAPNVIAAEIVENLE